MVDEDVDEVAVVDIVESVELADDALEVDATEDGGTGTPAEEPRRGEPWEPCRGC